MSEFEQPIKALMAQMGKTDQSLANLQSTVNNMAKTPSKSQQRRNKEEQEKQKESNSSN